MASVSIDSTGNITCDASGSLTFNTYTSADAYYASYDPWTLAFDGSNSSSVSNYVYTQACDINSSYVDSTNETVTNLYYLQNSCTYSTSADNFSFTTTFDDIYDNNKITTISGTLTYNSSTSVTLSGVTAARGSSSYSLSDITYTSAGTVDTSGFSCTVSQDDGASLSTVTYFSDSGVSYTGTLSDYALYTIGLISVLAGLTDNGNQTAANQQTVGSIFQMNGFNLGLIP